MDSSKGTRVPAILAQARALWLHNAAFHLRASDATGVACSLSRGVRQAVNAMASLNIALVRCKG
jgi:hypothetical protein